jgi:hypothetical protein
MVLPICNGMRDVLDATADPTVPRQLVNVLWSFERLLFAQWCEGLMVDTQEGTNRLHRALFNAIAAGPHGNIRAAQGIMKDKRRRSFNVMLARLLPLVLPPDRLKAVAVILTDESAEEQAGVAFAKQLGVFHPLMAAMLCGFHRLTQRLRDPSHFGASGLPSGVYDRIGSTLNAAARSCETRREAMITMQCLRAYGRRVLVPGKFLLLETFIDAAIAAFPKWTLFAVIAVLIMGLFTTSPTEAEQSLITRGHHGGWSLTTKSDLHAVVDKGWDSHQTRAAERDVKTHARSSTQAMQVPRALRIADRVLQPEVMGPLRERLERIQREMNKNWILRFDSEVTGRMHWTLSRVEKPKAAQKERLSVGPWFLRTSIIVLCRHPDSHFFLVCSCFLYQRELVPCECILALKRGHVDPFADFHFRWHVLYEREGAASLPTYTRSASDGQLDGPGTTGILSADLKKAMSDVPLTRNGVKAWLHEGGKAWVPLSVPVWGKSVSHNMWKAECTRTPLADDNDEPQEPEDQDASDADVDDDKVPSWVKTRQHFYRFYQERMKEVVDEQAAVVGRSSNRAEFLKSFDQAQIQMADISRFLSLRHPGTSKRAEPRFKSAGEPRAAKVRLLPSVFPHAASSEHF